MNRLFYLPFILTFYLSCQTASNEVADSIYLNGLVYTVNDPQPWAQAVAIRDGKFIFVGSNEDVNKYKGKATKTIDLKGSFVMPGIHDTHIHFEGFYNAKMLAGKTLRYDGTEKTIEELQAKLKEYANSNPELDVLFAEQLPLRLFPKLSPTKAFIDEIVPNRPVVMLTDTEHESVLNSVALEMEGIDTNTEVPYGGEIMKDSNGIPTGFLKEKAAGLWGWKHFPSLSRGEHYNGMKSTVQYLNSYGITSAKEQHAKPVWAQAFKDMDDKGELTMRIGLSWTYKGPLEPSSMQDQENTIENRKKYASDIINTEYIKLSIDGTLGGTGLVTDAYRVSGDYGIQFYDIEELTNDVDRFDSMGFGITAHANADSAVNLFVEAIARVKSRNGKLNGRHQTAHAVLINPSDLPKFKDLDITVEFSPYFWFPSAMADMIEPQIGSERLSRIFPMKSLQNRGGRFVLASDGPLFWQGPFPAIESAITRKLPEGQTSEDILAPNERIDLKTAIIAYTINGAYLMNQDDEVGSIERGKAADFIILNHNLFEIPVEKISETIVLKTIFNGQEVYSAN